MNKINKMLKWQLRIERNSARLYNFFIKKLKDKKETKKITRIRNDEKEHILLVEKMISIFNSH